MMQIVVKDDPKDPERITELIDVDVQRDATYKAPLPRDGGEWTGLCRAVRLAPDGVRRVGLDATGPKGAPERRFFNLDDLTFVKAPQVAEAS